MLKFIILIVTIIIVTLCVNININEPKVTPNFIETTQNNNVILEDANTLNENIVNAQNEIVYNNTLNIDEPKNANTSKPENKKDTNVSKPKDSSNKQENGTFISKEIPDNIYKKMLSKSIPTEYKDKVDLKSLRYLQISYFGFDGKAHVRRNDSKF